MEKREMDIMRVLCIEGWGGEGWGIDIHSDVAF